MTIACAPATFAVHPQLLRERIILITGANGAIGQAVASAAAACGAQLILAGRTPRRLNRLYDKIAAAGGAEPVSLPVDLFGSGPEQYAQVAGAIEQQFGRLDGLVHLASVFKGLSPLATTSPSDWLETLHVAIHTPFLLHQALLPLLRQSAAGRVVFALDNPTRTTKAYWGSYGVAKAALAALLRIMAEETEGLGIRVNGVIPPPVQSRLRQNLYMGVDPATPVCPEQVVEPWLFLLDPASEVATGEVLEWPAAD